MQQLINEFFLPDNHCFGCGHHNSHGLKIEVFQKTQDNDFLEGSFHPKPYMTGFPDVVHGGTIFTALDCFSSWTGVILRPEPALWLLRSTEVTYHAPAIVNESILIKSWIIEKSEMWKPVIVQAEAYNPRGVLLVSGKYKEVPLSREKFLKITQRDSLPENFEKMLKMKETSS
ncbi:MAG: hypothetical protein H7A32_00895 [Deltaproteobacteria bacterium]|nr:hypothetical protein [Deltaproteobacteria bacterium]